MNHSPPILYSTHRNHTSAFITLLKLQPSSNCIYRQHFIELFSVSLSFFHWLLSHHTLWILFSNNWPFFSLPWFGLRFFFYSINVVTLPYLVPYLVLCFSSPTPQRWYFSKCDLSSTYIYHMVTRWVLGWEAG